MSHFSHTSVYFVPEEEDEVTNGVSEELSVSSELDEESESDDMDSDEAI